MPRRLSDQLFDLGDFSLSSEARELVPFADAWRLVRRHARGEWGEVSDHQAVLNASFAHPKNRRVGSAAQSVHHLGNLLVCVRTEQRKGRRLTRLFLV